MSNSKDTENQEQLLDRAIESVVNATPSDSEIEASAKRTWEMLERSAAGEVVSDPVAAAVVSQNSPLRSHEDFVALIPDYLAGRLSEARTLLFEEQTRSSIPLRRALAEARSASQETDSAPRRRAALRTRLRPGCVGRLLSSS